jgi:hypothetical protein
VGEDAFDADPGDDLCPERHRGLEEAVDEPERVHLAVARRPLRAFDGVGSEARREHP